VALRTHDEILRFLRPYRGRNLLQVHTGDNQWLAKARNFTAAHTLVECGGYGYVAINSSGPIDLGSDETTGLPHRVCCFGRTGPILYSNVSLLHATAAREAVEDDPNPNPNPNPHPHPNPNPNANANPNARQAVEDDRTNTTKLYPQAS